MSRRFATLLPVAVVLVGGVALAQADLIVDPWSRVLSGKAPKPAVAAAPEAGRAPRPDNGWFGEADRTAPARPVVVPGPPVVTESIVDPWVPRAKVTPTPAPLAAEDTPHALHPGDWARVLPEIIDPWGPRRLAAYTDPLIVDPWPSN